MLDGVCRRPGRRMGGRIRGGFPALLNALPVRLSMAKLPGVEDGHRRRKCTSLPRHGRRQRGTDVTGPAWRGEKRRLGLDDKKLLAAGHTRGVRRCSMPCRRHSPTTRSLRSSLSSGYCAPSGHAIFFFAAHSVARTPRPTLWRIGAPLGLVRAGRERGWQRNLGLPL